MGFINASVIARSLNSHSVVLCAATHPETQAQLAEGERLSSARRVSILFLSGIRKDRLVFNFLCLSNLYID